MYKVTYVKNDIEGSYPAVSSNAALELAREHEKAGDWPVKVFDDRGHRVDLHTLELAVRGTRFG